MAEKDLATKKLEDYTDVFADILNTLLFKEDYIEEQYLKPGQKESIYKTDSTVAREQRRDTLMEYLDSVNVLVSSYGIENQTSIEKYMPVRVMSYDSGSYNDQLKRDGKIHPVITVVLNFSDEQWLRNKSLHDIMDIPNKLKPYVKNYDITVFDIAYLEDDVIDAFKSDFGAIARFFKNKRLGLDALSDTRELKHVHEVLEMLTAFTMDKDYENVEKYVTEHMDTNGGVSMCTVAQNLISQGRNEGIQLGRTEGIQLGRTEGRTEGIDSMLKALRSMGIDEELIRKAEIKAAELDEQKTM